MGRCSMRLVAGLPRIVNWTCFDEWKLAYEYLYSGTVIDRIKGVEMISLWSCRGRLPVAIEATGNFVELLTLNGAAYSEEQLRNAFAMALIRFVNGILDQQQKQAYAQSISRLAERIQFPRWLVDLRHEATHTIFPSLELLKISVEESLKWLKDNYWDIQLNYLPNLKKDISVALDCYKKQRKEYLASLKNHKGDKKVGDRQSLKLIMEIENIKTSEFIRRMIIEELLKFGKLFSKKQSNSIIKYDRLDIWKPLLANITELAPNFPFEILLELVDHLIALETHLEPVPKDFENSELLESIISVCVKNPFESLTITLKHLVQLDGNKFSKFVFNPFKRKKAEIESEDEIEIMKQRILEFKRVDDLESTLDINGWHLVNDFKPCPIGLLPNQTPNQLFKQMFE